MKKVDVETFRKEQAKDPERPALSPGDVKKMGAALARVRASPEDRSAATALARLLWGSGGVAVVENRPTGVFTKARVFMVGKRAGDPRNGKDLAFANLGEGRDFAAAFKAASQRGKEAQRREEERKGQERAKADVDAKQNLAAVVEKFK